MFKSENFNFASNEERASMKFYLTEALLTNCEMSSSLIFLLNGFSFIYIVETAFFKVETIFCHLAELHLFEPVEF